MINDPSTPPRPCSCGNPRKKAYYLACEECWALIPKPLQTEVYRLYKEARGSHERIACVRLCYQAIRDAKARNPSAQAPEYQPIPVIVAQHLAEQFDKSAVVIVANDDVHNCTHFTTYGVTAQNKAQAAEMAEAINKAIGTGKKIKTFEDFRYMPAAEAQATIDKLGKELDLAKTALHVPGIWSCPKCGFTQHNRTLSAATGAVGIDQRPELRSCPNDGRDLQPVTWKELAKSNSDGIERIAGNYVALQRVAEGAEHMLRSLLAVRDGIPNERLEEMADALNAAHSKPAAA